MRTIFRELAGLIGFASFGFGLWYIWWPLCPTVLGAILMLAAVIGHLRSKPSPPPIKTEHHAAQ